MGSFQHYPALLIVSSAFFLFMVMPAINANDAAELFEEVFSNKENVFNSVYLINTLPDGSWIDICNTLRSKGFKDEIELGYETNVLVQQPSGQRIYVSAYFCDTIHTEDDTPFLFTYSVTENETRFFKLNPTEDEDEHNQIINTVVDSRIIPKYQKTINELRNEIFAHFATSHYKTNTTNWFRHLQEEDSDWMNLCRLHFEEAITVKPPPGDRIRHIETIIHGKSIKIPVFSCPLLNPGEFGYIAFYINDYRFKVEVTYDNKTKKNVGTANYDVFDLINNEEVLSHF